MVIPYFRFLAGRERTREANRHLGLTLAFVAGAVNAGGYLAVSRYTSHMTGMLSSIGDSLALGQNSLAAAALASWAAFVAGAASCAVLINWARRRGLQSQYALALLAEAALLLVFGLLGSNLTQRIEVYVPATVLLLCFMMGLQNAMITKLSGAEIRTTHMTGNSTDLGIELGKLLYWNRLPDAQGQVRANREKLKIHASLVGLFVLGGFVGAQSFKHLGFASTIPLALLLAAVSLVPVLDDLLSPAPQPRLSQEPG